MVFSIGQPNMIFMRKLFFFFPLYFLETKYNLKKFVILVYDNYVRIMRLFKQHDLDAALDYCCVCFSYRLIVPSMFLRMTEEFL